MKPQPIHRRLRAATDALHDEVDRQAADFDLATPAGQRAFLEMMVRGLGRVEPALERGGVLGFFPQWPSRTRLEAAREELGGAGSRHSDEPLEYAGEAEVWGALYVLEGSRLGSRMLARKAPGSRFLAASAEDRTWPDFLEALGTADERLSDAAGMIRGARKTFAAFLR